MSQDARTEPMSTLPATADDRRFRWLGFLIVLVVFGGFGTWAMIAPLSSAAHAPGLLAVESYRKTVQHLEGGIVKTIEVRDGQSVEKDQVLLTLEDTQPRAQLEVLRGQYFITQAREARLLAQRDGLGQVRYPVELLANREELRVQEAMRVQDQTFRVRKSAHEGEISLYEQQIGQLQAKAAGVRSQRASREQLVASFRGELDDYQALLKQGYAEKQKVREFERNLANAEGQLGELVANVAAIDLQVNETKLKILQLHKDLQREVAKELSEVQAQLFELREKMQSVQDTVSRTVIRAPQAGTVLDLQAHTLGAVIKPGAKLLDIVPRGERLVVEAKVSTIDIDRIHVGQTAEIRFTAFKTRDTPRVDGKLITLSADRLIDETDQQRTPYYLARIEITSDGMKDLSRHKLELVAGMPAEVLINTGERTLFHYLIDPIKNTVARSFIED
jgi:membrane fusion protein, type I secretion system